MKNGTVKPIYTRLTVAIVSRYSLRPSYRDRHETGRDALPRLRLLQAASIRGVYGTGVFMDRPTRPTGSAPDLEGRRKDECLGKSRYTCSGHRPGGM